MNQAVKSDIIHAEMIGIRSSAHSGGRIRNVDCRDSAIVSRCCQRGGHDGNPVFRRFGRRLDQQFPTECRNDAGPGRGHRLCVAGRKPIQRRDADTERRCGHCPGCHLRNRRQSGDVLGAAVLIGFVAMSFIDLPIFRSFSIGGITVVLLSVLAGNTLLPALLGILGPRIETLPLFPAAYRTLRARQTSGLWRRLSKFVMAHPVTISIAAIGLLLVAIYPVRDMNIAIPAAEVLPRL